MKETNQRGMRIRVVLLMLLSLGLALRVGYVLTLIDRPFEGDEVDYTRSAVGLLRGGGFDRTVYYHVPPVPPLLLAVVYSVTGADRTAAMLFQCGLFLVSGWVAFLLGRELAGDLCGLVTLAFVSVYPYFIFFTGQVGTEAPALVAIPAMVLAAIRAAREPKALRAMLLGVLLAVATLTRASVLYFIVSVPVIFAMATGLRNTKWLGCSGAALGGFLALYLPWCTVNRHYFGEWIATPTIGSGILAYRTALRLTIPDDAERWAYVKREVFPKYYYPPGATHAERLAGDRFMVAEGRRIIAANLSGMPRLIWHNFKSFWQFYPNFGQPGVTRRFFKVTGLATYGVLFPFILAGLAVCLPQVRRLSPTYLFIAYFTAVHTALFGMLRYRIPMDPLLLAFAAVGLLAALRAAAPQLLEAAERSLSARFELSTWRHA